MKVLIIDNDKFTRTVYESELHQQNIEVNVAEDGKDGLDKARKDKPDLIILDLILPKLNGFEVLKELKSDSKLKDVPVLVSSILAQKNDINEASDIWP
jgi:DNA-binding response OmpR family regulator